MNIPEKAVDAVVETYLDRSQGASYEEADFTPWREAIRETLEAAYPSMAAQVLRDEAKLLVIDPAHLSARDHTQALAAAKRHMLARADEMETQ